MTTFQKYKVYEGNYASLEEFQASESGIYVASIVEGSPVDVNIIMDREDNGDVVVKWIYNSEEDGAVFREYATKDSDDNNRGISVVGIVGHKHFPGRIYNI